MRPIRPSNLRKDNDGGHEASNFQCSTLGRSHWTVSSLNAFTTVQTRLVFTCHTCPLFLASICKGKMQPPAPEHWEILAKLQTHLDGRKGKKNLEALTLNAVAGKYLPVKLWEMIFWQTGGPASTAIGDTVTPGWWNQYQLRMCVRWKQGDSRSYPLRARLLTQD